MLMQRFCYAASIMVFVGIGLTACQQPAPARVPSMRTISPPVTVATNTPALTIEQVRQASRLYHAKCGRCHQFYDPAAYQESEWREWMAKMSRKSRLTADQTQLLNDYLGAYRAGQITSPP